MHSVTQTILFDYFDGKSSPLQRQLIEEWIKDPVNTEVFYQCLEKWELNKLQYLPDLSEAHQKYLQRLESEEISQNVPLSAPISLQPGRAGTVVRNHYWMVAACILFILSSGVFLARDFILYTTYTAEYGQIRSVQLNDGSEVELNANSRLKVRNTWGLAPQREVWLKGEGFFSIARQPDHQKFTVHTDQLTVEVLGTKFNVAHRRNRTTVVLSEGKVKLTANAGTKKSLLMQPGDYIELSEKDTIFNRKTVSPEKYIVWKENELFFENAPLPEVLQKVEDYYGVKILLQDTTVAGKRFTSSLPNNNLDVVLKSIASVYHLEVSRKQNRVILR
jgi:ferric-dicitrate binding protein FerR (iron transport regulator)